MNSSLARAFKIEEIEEDPSLAQAATKECFSCDLDNPKAVIRATCTVCKGTGRQLLAAVAIAKELAVSKKKMRFVPEEDLSLEY